MPTHKSRFLAMALRADALRFGEFTLKSGRRSPYFFNAGRFDSGTALAGLAACYADALEQAGLAFDLLFGPAYKGIPLATALGCEYARRGRDLPLAFNRKEAKDHGEGGRIVGRRLEGRVLIVDDVITAGTAVRESVALIRDAGAQPVGIALALDREERGQGERSAVQEVEAEFGLRCISILTLTGLIEALAAGKGDADRISGEHHAALQAYRARYGVA